MRDNFNKGVLLDGRFQTIAPLNHGSFGMVFMAKDMQTDDLVAVKCLTKPTFTSPCPIATPTDDSTEELACHALLGSHPNIVNLIHSFETDSHVYLILEFCSMGDLYEAIRLGRGPLETEHVRDFMFQLVGAVEFIHSKGLYHRDIKPENIFLTQSGTLKLGDFGLATTEDWSYESNVGSDRYMAPEQYDTTGNGYSPAKADIWAIGICLLNILFSRNPFAVPTESDPLFADYVRDKQSLFDVFPTMSQDTFEVLVAAMALDPEKRSLAAVRDALNRVVSFTTDDESLDEFCTEDREVVALSANREPLRTPSIQSPQIAQGSSFPWAQALQTSPQLQFRQLTTVVDDEIYTEDLFPASEKNSDWFSVVPETPSVASVLDSGLGSSFKSMAIRRPARPSASPRSVPVQMSASVPIPTTKLQSAISSVFGKKNEVVSKSWSDLWDEDEEEEAEREREEALEQRRTQNARSWSQESNDDDRTIRPRGLVEAKPCSIVNNRSPGPKTGRTGNPRTFGLDGVNENDDFFFEEHHSPRHSPSRKSPSRKSIMDKWAALGDRRRAYHPIKNKTEKSGSVKLSTKRDSGLGFTVHDNGVWEKHARPRVHHVSDDVEELEWVGGWHDLHL
jgi:serine/threonine protein kinase